VARITAEPRSEILRWAETTPSELGLPWRRWSLAQLCDYLGRRKLVRALRREHRRRLLKKGACPGAGFGANSSASLPSGQPF
jgi:hypothetical protein